MKKLYIQTYGCQMNQHDSERITQVMARMNYVQTDRIDAADLILLNTCSVRDKSEQKVYSALGHWKELKEHREGVISSGRRVAQQEGESCQSECIWILSSARTTFKSFRKWWSVSDCGSALSRPRSIVSRIIWKLGWKSPSPGR
jgi:tRNA-2-methylthio-N6-dimethylallyladenosine synthase